jgi:hypothetical protein
VYRKLKRVWSHNNANYIPKFREIFPELNNVSSEEMCDRWIELGVDFYTDKKTPIKIWTRLTLPFAIVLIVLMIIAIPFIFILTGEWKYPLGEKNRILNWYRSLRLL